MGINERVQIIHSHLVLLEKEIQFANLRGKLTYLLRFLSGCLGGCLATQTTINEELLRVFPLAFWFLFFD